MPNKDTKKKLCNRLKTIKGHVNGIEKMIESEKPCEDILLQISAIKSSMSKVGDIVMEDYVKECIVERANSGKLSAEALDDVIKSIIKFAK